MKVIVTERIAEEGIQYLRDQGLEVDERYGIEAEELGGVIAGYDAIIVRSVTQVNEALIDKGVNLKVAGRAGNGIDNIDVASCTGKGIIVVNTPESNVMATAELAVGLSFALFRNLPQVRVAVRNKDFRRNLYIGNELDEKTVGVIGLGRIGSIVATKLKGCNMRVLAYDPYVTDEKFARLGVERCETLDELLIHSDLITLHTPKTKETYGMLGERQLRTCKKGVRIVNCARGGLVEEKALYEAIKSGHVASAAIDVLDPEPNFDTPPERQKYHNALMDLDNVFLTPHLGASTEEANYNVGTAVARLVASVLQGELVAAVNVPAMSRDRLAEMNPYLELAEMLGKIYYQAEKETCTSVEVIFSGDLASAQDTKVLSLAALKGFLTPVRQEKVNYVNAEMLLQSMGIEFTETKRSEIEKYTNLITVRFRTKNKDLSVSGTVFAKSELRIVDFFGYKLDFEPTKVILAIQNL
ncbi:MAG: phosphoglycerate dehydrogenase, partial [Oscillospiraceae bacterium]|nr:phosphoglycerate dehydrogenase [Oscillospiraceae bacterium]